MKFFITFMLVLMMMIITGLSAYVLHAGQEEKISSIFRRLSIVEKQDKGKIERQKINIDLNSLKNNLNKTINNVVKLNDKLITEIAPIALKNQTDIKNITRDLDLYCTVSPEANAIGSDRYPTNEKKYEQSGYCGELFTADDCGLDRLTKVFGVGIDGSYMLGMTIFLEEKPSYGFRTNLQRLGFTPAQTCVEEKECKRWSNKEEINRKGIQRLKSYAKEIKYCDCINCG